MNALLLLGQLVIPSLPQNVTPENFFQYTLETVSCVDYAEADGVVYALDSKTGAKTETRKYIVAVKDGIKAANCAKQIEKEIEGVKIDSVLSTLGFVIVSAEVPVIEEPKAGEE